MRYYNIYDQRAPDYVGDLAPDCPKCGSESTYYTDIDPHGYSAECEDCGHEWEDFEIPEKEEEN